MAAIKQKITPCLWFDSEAEDAAKFYIAIFPQFPDQADQPLWRSRP